MSDVYNPFEMQTRISLSPKYTCLIRPAQSGKTRTMQELMVEYERMSKVFYPEDENILNIVICSKNLNLVRQTEARMQEVVVSDDDTASETEEADDKIVGDIFSWMTGTKDNNISAEALFTKILRGRVRMVICCAHKRRLQYLAELLAICDEVNLNKRINIWMDEADAYTNIWSEIDFARYRKVNEVYLVSATIDTIVEKHERVKVKPFIHTFPACYHKTQDSHIVEVAVETRDPVEYLATVYNRYKETLKVPGMRMFAPGDDMVASHNAIAEFLAADGWAVAIINGRRKVILVPGMEEPLDITKQVPKGTAQEIGKTIAKMYRDYNLARFPFAITGKLCLSRGITFQCEEWKKVDDIDEEGNLTETKELDYDFLFDAGIIPPISRRDELYQCLSRTNGNIRNFGNYAPPTLYMTAATRSLATDAEKIAINLAVLVHRYNFQDVGVEEMDFAIHENEQQYEKDKAEPEKTTCVIQVDADTITNIYESSTSQKRAKILNLLPEALATKLSNYKCKQVTMPKAELQYKKVVTDVVSRVQRGEIPSVFKEDEKKTNVWQAVLDNRENRIIVSYNTCNSA